MDIVLAIEAATEGRVKPSTWTEDSLRADDDSGTDVDPDATGPQKTESGTELAAAVAPDKTGSDGS